MAAEDCDASTLVGDGDGASDGSPVGGGEAEGRPRRLALRYSRSISAAYWRVVMTRCSGSVCPNRLAVAAFRLDLLALPFGLRGGEFGVGCSGERELFFSEDLKELFVPNAAGV